MTRLISAPVAVLLLSLAGCREPTPSAPANLLTSNNFDQLEGWVTDDLSAYLTHEQAHSGATSAHVGPTVEYAAGYTSTLGNLSSVRLAKMRLRAWVWVPDKEAKALLVAQVLDPATGKSLYYDATDLAGATAGKFSQWVAIDKTLTLPPEVTANSVFKAYLWRAQSPQPVYLDDFELTKVE